MKRIKTEEILAHLIKSGFNGDVADYVNEEGWCKCLNILLKDTGIFLIESGQQYSLYGKSCNVCINIKIDDRTLHLNIIDLNVGNIHNIESIERVAKDLKNIIEDIQELASRDNPNIILAAGKHYDN